MAAHVIFGRLHNFRLPKTLLDATADWSLESREFRWLVSVHNRYQGTIGEQVRSLVVVLAKAADQFRDGAFDITLAIVFEKDFFQNERLKRDPCC
jgi:hypothetical protein